MRTRIIHLVLLTLALAGCNREPLSPTNENGILLNLVLEDPQTKTERNGDGALNENVLSPTIDIFFYDESTLAITKEALHVVRSGSLVQIPTTPDDISSIFSGTTAVNATCGVFVVANFAGTYQGTPGSRTITQIKSSLLPAPNWETLPQANFVMTGEKQAKLSASANSTTPIHETVNLARIAAKVTFDVTVAENASGDNSWTPDTDHMSVYMVYAMRKATLGADPVNMPASDAVAYEQGGTVVYPQYVDKNLYDTGTTRSRNRNGNNVQCKVYSTTHDGEKPFYTYPCTWVTGSSMEPYLKLIIPWSYNNTTRKYYYKIPFAGNSLERNHWYHISIDVQILGIEQADPPQVGITYSIADWSGSMDNSAAGDFTSPTSVPAAVITSHYLNIPITEYVLYNEDELIIPMQSSHDVEVVGFTVDTDNAYKPAHYDNDANYVGDNPGLYNPYSSTLLSAGTVRSVRPDYSAETPSSVPYDFSSNSDSDPNGWKLKVNGRESISFTHPLERNISSNNYDAAPYTLRFRARHQGDASGYYVDITIEQRPSIIIRPQRNSDNGAILSATNSRGKGHTAEDGYVFDNGVRSNTDMSVGRSNTNFNMYIVETSVLPTGGGLSLSNYVLGDPRQTTSVSVTSGKSTTDFAQGADIAGGSNRRMANYYPAAEDEEHNVFIAPAFRIASSFGATGEMNRNTAVYHCATYQEDGYPAGRWRLPTRAEIEYMVTLSQKGKIPPLFSTESDVKYGGYWCSAGAVFPLDDGTLPYKNLQEATTMTVYSSSSGNSLGTGVQWTRCVYDEWFWSDTQHERADKLVWTWGDEARNTVSKR